MSSGLYSTDKKSYSKSLDLGHLKPYGDTLNDGKVQVSFTLPIKDDDKGVAAAKELGLKMGLLEPTVAHHQSLDEAFTFYVVYGTTAQSINYHNIHVESVDIQIMDMHETDDFINTHFNRDIVVVGASTGTDAHTVGIDAIMNMKGYAGVYGLERYQRIHAVNMGSQVPNEELIKCAIELNADAILVSQTVTQNNVHVQNLTELIELMEAASVRGKFIIIVGGARISHELAKELGFDAGFGPGKFADSVATYIVEELKRREENDGF